MLGPSPVNWLVCAAVLAMAVVALGGFRSSWAPEGAPYVGVVNLDRNADRLGTFLQKYESSDFAAWPCGRVAAVDGKRADWERVVEPVALNKLMIVQKTGVREDHPDLTPGAVGCYLSHMMAWRRIVASGRPWGLVFEDDADVPAGARRALEAHMRTLPSDWDVFLLGYEAHGTPEAKAGGLLSIPRFCRLHAYAITARAAERLARTMLPMTQQVDWAMSDRIQVGDLKVYASPQQIVPFTWQGTEIQTPLNESV